MMRDNWMTQLRKGVLELVVLEVLHERKRYGYDLVQRICEVTGLEVGEGTVYPMLNRMKRSGLISSELVESSEGPARKYYRLTRIGRRELGWMRGEWAALVDRLAILGESSDD